MTLTGGEHGVPAKVTVVEPTGADTFVYADIAGTQACAVFTERHGFAPGEVIRLQPNLGVVHLFDAASGRVLH
jgi:multiple sugar transport system ATP-binding protein